MGYRWYLLQQGWRRHFWPTIILVHEKYEQYPNVESVKLSVAVRFKAVARMKRNAVSIQAYQKNDHSINVHRNHVVNGVRQEKASSTDDDKTQCCRKLIVHVAHSCKDQDNDLHAVFARAWKQKYKDAIKRQPVYTVEYKCGTTRHMDRAMHEELSSMRRWLRRRNSHTQVSHLQILHP